MWLTLLSYNDASVHINTRSIQTFSGILTECSPGSSSCSDGLGSSPMEETKGSSLADSLQIGAAGSAVSLSVLLQPSSTSSSSKYWTMGTCNPTLLASAAKLTALQWLRPYGHMILQRQKELFRPLLGVGNFRVPTHSPEGHLRNSPNGVGWSRLKLILGRDEIGPKLSYSNVSVEPRKYFVT